MRQTDVDDVRRDEAAWTQQALWSTVALAAHVALVVAAFMFVPINRKPSSATAWLLLITAAPFIGLILFLLVGSPKLPARRRKLQRQMTTRIAGTAREGRLRS